MNTPAADPAQTVRELSLPIHQSRGWLRLVGVLSILSGALTALSLVGIVIAWLPIWIGVVLLQAASGVERAQVSGEKEDLFRSLSKLRTYFVVQGVLLLIGLILTAASLIVAFAMGMLGTLAAALGG